MGEGARLNFGLALGDRMVFLGEVDWIIGDGIRTGEDAFVGFLSRIVGGVPGEGPKIASERLDIPGILTGVEGRRGLVSPLLGLRGCGKDRRGLPKGLEAGLGLGVLGPGVRVSELETVFRPSDSDGLTNRPVQLSGIRYLPFIKSKSSLEDSPKSCLKITTSDREGSIFIAGMSGESESQRVSHVAIGACLGGCKKLSSSVWLSSLSIDSSRAGGINEDKKLLGVK